MTLQELIIEIAIFCEKETQKIIAELEMLRFANQGDFNGHKKWVDNDNWKYRHTMSVQRDKGRNEPLVDSGELRKELTTAENWDLKPRFDGKKLTLTIEDRETFTDSKYDVLDTGGKVPAYKSSRGNYIEISYVPSRPFKDLSSQDIAWICDKLVEAIRGQYA